MNIDTLTPRELVAGLMRGYRPELRLGYSPANAALAAKRLHPGLDPDELRGYSEGYSDGMQRSESMVLATDPDTVENCAYREGYIEGLSQDVDLTYPSQMAI